MSKMLEEIREQPEALERTLRMGLKAAAKLAREIAKKRPKLIVLAARGTSDNAAQFGRYLLEITTGIPVSLAAPSLFTLYDAKLDLKDALIVAISQSGESTDTNLVLERGREQGALTVGITNEPASSLAKLADHLFFVRAGRERSVAATKTYTGQVMSLYLLAHALGGQIPLDDLRRIPDWAAKSLELEDQITARAERYRFMERAIVVGRGLNYSNAFEFALKLMETCYVVAERFSTADFLHGPIAMVESSFPMFLFTPSGVTWDGMRDMIGRLSALQAETLIFTDIGNRAAIESNPRAVVIPVKIAKELYTPIPYIIPAQIFAATLAGWKGLDPDRPRTLSKVTRTL
jgi:glucosamine--fructose-6-phosphate aminotransferase (isomerizing)